MASFWLGGVLLVVFGLLLGGMFLFLVKMMMSCPSFWIRVVSFVPMNPVPPVIAIFMAGGLLWLWLSINRV